jgi:hypothetical protein
VVKFALGIVLAACLCSAQDTEQLYVQSNQLRTAGKLAEAPAAMDKAIALNPAKAEYFRARASLKLALKDYTGVEEVKIFLHPWQLEGMKTGR